jgi:hypothetical protein
LQRIEISSAQKKISIDIVLPQGELYQTLIVPFGKGDFMHVAGTIAQEKGYLYAVFYQKLNTITGKLSSIKITPFSTELVQHIDKKDEGSWAYSREKKFGLFTLPFEGFDLEDGGLSLIGEFEREVPSEKYTSLRSGSMLNIRFNNGEAIVGYIPKYRVSAGSSIGSSYYAHPYKNQLLIFYTDRAENANLGTMEKFKNSNKYNELALFYAYMDASGKIQRKVLLDVSNDSYLPVADAARRFTSNTFLIPLKKIKSLGGLADESKWLTLKVE